MWKRRLVFATPFVLVAGCKRPIERDAADDRRPIAATPDAYYPPPEPPPIDAPAADHVMTAEEVTEHCKQPGVSCNPPSPKKPASIPQVTGKIVNIAVTGTPPRTHVTVAVGSRDSIAKDWTAEIHGPKGRLGVLTVLRVEHRTTVGVTDLGPDQIIDASVVFQPPR